MTLINEGNFHIFGCGLTQSGKSYFFKRAMLEMSAPVIYFNIQGERVPPGFMTVYTDRIEMDQLVESLQDGIKVNLVFSNVRNGYTYVAGHVLNALMESDFDEDNPVYVVLEESHLLKTYSLEIAKYVATAGLKKGVRLICITQRPALCDKTLYTQAFEHYIFFITEADAAYMRGKGIDYDTCKAEWARLGKHSYCYYNGYTLEGRPPI
jgi:DNA helicase HerA-like ATPase